MADDPNRDLLPVRDGSYIETYRSIAVDPRERHQVSKIDRDDLEDKYLRLLDECQELKKLSNSQEDKIKRLATKLIRVSTTPRTYISTTLDGDSDRNKIEKLKNENEKLKEKIVVLRNQILSHRVLKRSPSQTRRLTMSASSRPTTCRSESGRLKSTYQNFIHDRDDDAISRNYANKIAELEEQRKRMVERIVELENKLVFYQTGCQKDKIAENVEYIRVWRQMKLGREKLMEAEEMKKVLCSQIREMQNLLDETTKNNGQIAATLDAERKRLSEMSEQVTRSQDNQLREKDEQIRDLMNEMKILQQHNSELINLSTRYSQIELENSELKKKLSELLEDNYNLKSDFTNEQTNMKALQAANEQLMEKLQSTQSNIDNLTIQLKSMQIQYQNSSKPNSESDTATKAIKKTFDKQTSTTSLLSKYEAIDVINKKDDDNSQQFQQTNQNKTVESQHQPSTTSSKQHHDDTQLHTLAPNMHVVDSRTESPLKDKFENAKNNLTRDKMLKLLDEAQINTPLNTQGIKSVKQNEGLSPQNYAKKKYRQSSKFMHSGTSSLSASSSPVKGGRQEKMQNKDQNIIKKICKILVDYCQTNFNEIDGDSTTIFRSHFSPNSDNSFSAEHQLTDDKLAILSPHHSHDSNYQNINNTNILSKISNDITKHSSINNWQCEGKINCAEVISTEEFGELNQCVCNETQPCGQYCECDKNEKNCESGITRHSHLTMANDINLSLQSVTNNKRISDIQDCKPISTAVRLKTGLCCEPLKPMADKLVENYFLIMDKALIRENEVIVGPKYSTEGEKSCVIVVSDNTNNVTRITEKSENKNNPPEIANQYSPLLIADQEGLIEIHISSLVLSSLVRDTLFKKNDKIIERSLFISCEFHGEESISTSVIKYPDLNFNSSCIYRLANVDEFLNNIHRENVYLQLHIIFHKNLSYIIAHGKVNVKDIRIYPQNKLHYIINMESLVPCYQNKKFGQLSLWIRLSYNAKHIEVYKAQETTIVSNSQSPNKHIDKVIDDEEKMNSISPPINFSVLNTNELFKKSEILDNEKLANTSEKYNETQSDRPVKHIHQLLRPKNDVNEIYNTHTQVQGNSAVLKNNEDLNEHQQALKHNNIDDGNDTIVIVIERLKLMANCQLLQNPNVHRLYVEFSFLGNYGIEYETISVKLPKTHAEEMYFNYKKIFRFDEKTHLKERNRLLYFLCNAENPNIQFNIVSEPLEDKMEIEDCVGVGQAHFNFKKHVLNNSDPDIFLTVNNPENTESIGILKISILGINAVRQLLSQSC